MFSAEWEGKKKYFWVQQIQLTFEKKSTIQKKRRIRNLFSEPMDSLTCLVLSVIVFSSSPKRFTSPVAIIGRFAVGFLEASINYRS